MYTQSVTISRIRSVRPFFLICLFLGLLFSSCRSSKQLAKTREQREELSLKLGFKVSSKDHLQLYSEVSDWLGTPYRYGGNCRKGIDCSGLIHQIYKQVYNKELARGTEDIDKKNCRKIRKKELKTGDLVFFNTSQKKKKTINHVGLFLKEGYFIHASSSKGVMINHLNEKYYKNSWRRAGRVR